MLKIRVYIKPVEFSALDFSNVLTLGHQCDNPEARISNGIRHMPKDTTGLISDEERKTIDLVVQFSNEKGLDYEIVDLNKAGLMTQLKFIVKRLKVPVISVGNEAILGLPTKEDLESLVQEQLRH